VDATYEREVGLRIAQAIDEPTSSTVVGADER
jgi:hypothetical protein